LGEDFSEYNATEQKRLWITAARSAVFRVATRSHLFRSVGDFSRCRKKLWRETLAKTSSCREHSGCNRPPIQA